MPVTTMLELADKEILEEQGVADRARNSHKAAQDKQDEARRSIEQETAGIIALERNIADLRRQLPTAPTSQVQDLADQLLTKEAELTQRRTQVNALVRAVAEFGAEGRANSMMAERASERLAIRQADKVAAEKEVERRTQEWDPLLADAAILGLPAQATALITALSNANDALEANYPKKLLNAVRERHRALIRWRQAEAERVRLARVAYDAVRERDGGVEDETANEARNYEIAYDAIASFLRNGKALIEAGNQLSAETVPAPSAQQKEALKPNPDRNAAADSEKKLHEKQIAEAESLEALEEAELRYLRDPAQDPQPARRAHAQKQEARDLAAQAFTAEQQALLFAWQAEAPEKVWSYLAQLEELSARLDEVKRARPAQMKQKLDETEQKLAEGLEIAFGKRRPWTEIEVRLLLARLRSDVANAQS